MPRLVITNVTSSATGVFDPTGLSDTKIAVPANSTVTTDVTSRVLENLATQLSALTTSSVITWRVDDDPDVNDSLEALGPRAMPLKVLQQTVTTADLTASATAQNVALTGFPADSVPVMAVVELNTVFAGGAASNAVVSVGDAADPDEYCTDQAMLSGLGMKSAPGVSSGEYVFETAYVPVARVTTTGADVDTLTSGSMVVHLYYLTPVQYT